MNKIKFPYLCEIKDTKEKFTPTVIDYDNKMVWHQTSLVSEDGKWYAFEELLFFKHKNFIGLENLNQVSIAWE